MDEQQRSLTDEDVKALVDELERRGVWGFAWKIIVLCIMLVAAWGAFKGGRLF